MTEQASLEPSPSIYGDDPEFPVEVAWIDLLHDKSHLSRSTAAWVGRFFDHHERDGTIDVEFVCRCWASAFLGAHSLTSQIKTVFLKNPDSARAVFENAPTRDILARHANEYLKASIEWVPPSDPKLRKWSKVRPDDDIQKSTREKFKGLAVHCRMASEIGLAQTIKLYALRSPEIFDWPCYRSTPSPDQLHHIALSMILGAKQHARMPPGHDDEELFCACARLMAPKTFRQALTALVADPVQLAKIAGEAIRQSAVLIAEANAKIAADPSKKSAPPGSHTPNQQAEINIWNRRVFDTLNYFTKWSMTQYAKDPQVAFAFVDSTTHSNVQSTSRIDLDAFFALTSSRGPSTTFALACWQTAKDRGLSIDCSEASRALVWKGHLPLHADPRSPLQALILNNLPGNYATQHLTLAAAFPHPESEKLSRSFAGGKVLAAIEEGELLKLIPAFAATPDLDADIDDATPDSEPPPTSLRKKTRL
jgi:hypothetical protein